MYYRRDRVLPVVRSSSLLWRSERAQGPGIPPIALDSEPVEQAEGMQTRRRFLDGPKGAVARSLARSNTTYVDDRAWMTDTQRGCARIKRPK